MQLLAYGAQDVYLTGQPQVTFFKAVYKRYCNFAMEFYKNQISDAQSNGSTLRIPITRYGDLIGQMYFELPLTQSVIGQYVTDNTNPDLNWIAERAFSSIELQIGNNTIDKHYQLWWRLYSILFMTASNREVYDKMTTFSGATAVSSTPTVYLPLNFFFNRNPGLYLPLIALQYHEVQLVCTCSPTYTSYFNNGATLWVNYVILDADERKRFGTKEHEYLIEQVQNTNDTVPSNNGRMRVVLKHPVKEIIWCYPNQSGINKHWDYTVYNNTVNLTCNPTSGTSPFTCGTPKLAGVPWTEDGDVTYRQPQKSLANILGTSTTSPLTSVFASSSPGALNIKSNIQAGRITVYNVTTNTSDRVVLTLSNGTTTTSNTFYLPAGQSSNAALLSSFANTSQVWVRTQAFGGYTFATSNVVVSDVDNLNTNAGKHYVRVSNVIFTRTTANTLSNLQPLTLTINAPTLGFNGVYGTSSFANVAISSNTVMYAFDNTYGKDYSISSTDRITYTLSNGNTTYTSNMAFTAGTYSDPSLYTQILSTLQSNIRQIPTTTLRPFVFGNVIVSANTIGGGDNIILSTGPAPGKHSFIFSNIEATGGTPSNVSISGNVYGTIGNKLGFYTNNTFTNVASYVQVGASNAFTMGTPGYASNVVANAFPTFQYNIPSANVKATSYPLAQYNYSVQTLADPFIDVVLPLGGATSNIVLDVLTGSNTYTAYSNSLPGPFTTGPALATAVTAAANTIISGATPNKSFVDFSNAVISTTSSGNFVLTIEGVLTRSNIGSLSTVNFDGRSQLYPAPASSVGPLGSVKVFFNGQERFTHTGKFLNQVMPLSFHSGNPWPGVYNYSFALKPEDYQPSGTCNFSRLDSVEVVPTMKPMSDAYDPSYNTVQSIFAVNYNILRIKSGMASVVFV